jgi:hypothetical protein
VFTTPSAVRRHVVHITFGIQGFGFRVKGLGFRVLGLGFRV